MGFMEQQIEFGKWVIVDGNCGGECIPFDICPIPDCGEDEDSADYLARVFPILRDYVESTRLHSVAVREGWGARLSAPGYLDCTEWSVFDSEQEAREYLEETYGNEHEDE